MIQAMPVLDWMKVFWKYILVFVAPIIFAIIPIVWPSQEAKCGYVIIIMATYWMTEAIPMAVTSLIPVFAFPLLGILSTADCCLVYMKQTNMMFLGGLMVAIAIEHCNLHKRIALFVILHVGQSPKRLMAGFMLTTMFLSMWISNTATTAMMVPIVNAILTELYPPKRENDGKDAVTSGEENEDPNQMEMVPPKGVENEAYDPDINNHDDKDPSTVNGKVIENAVNGKDAIETANAKNVIKTVDDKAVIESVDDEDVIEVVDEEKAVGKGEIEVTERVMMGRALFLGVAYSANVGGTGVVTGTAPNLVMMALLSTTFSESSGLNFATWMAFNIPGMLICVFIAWIWLQFLFMGLFRKNSPIQSATPEREAAVRHLISTKYKELGRMSQHEVTVLILFLLLVSFWLFRDPEFIPGWATLFLHDKRIGDATPAMLIVFLLFAIPSKVQLPCIRGPANGNRSLKPSPACMSWKAVHDKVPWNVVLLLGGGFAVAEAAKVSGLSAWLGIQFETLSVLPKEAIVLVVCSMTAMLTEVASNTATASVLLPVLLEMSLNINVNPIYLMLPATICCSYAFMLPVATAPNAIVFSVANMKSSEMMKAGFAMNAICVLVITVMINTLGVAMFDLHNMPPWTNSTTTAGRTL